MNNSGHNLFNFQHFFNLMQLQKAKQMTNLAKKLNFVFGRDENILGKRENAGYQHFLLFPQCFQKASFLGSFKIGIAW